MMESSEEGSFDVIIIGTGLTESIIAAALSKAGYKIAHIDRNTYYGDNEAAVSQDELIKWGEDVQLGKHTMFYSYTGSTQILPYHRQYSLCLRPSVIPSLGPLISALIASGVSKYSGFRLVDSVSVYGSNGTVNDVPGSKEEVFKSKDISLLEKRRLMRFLTFAAGEFEDRNELAGKHDTPFTQFLTSSFSLNDQIAIVIAYSLAHCVSTSDPTLPSLKRLRKYLQSIGRYGPSPFLIGHYGGIGDIAQGFCRAAAVNGAVYILGRPILSVTDSDSPPTSESVDTDPPRFKVTLDDFPDPLTCKLIISGKEHIPTELGVEVNYVAPSEPFPATINSVARCIAIIDKPLAFRPFGPYESTASDNEQVIEKPASQQPKTGVDTAILVFPPSSLPQGSSTTSATVLLAGEGSLSTPKGKWILHIMLPVISPSVSEPSAEELLQPYLDAVLALTIEPSDPAVTPLFTSFYYEHVENTPAPSEPTSPATAALPRYLVTPPLNFTAFPDLPDLATLYAEDVFRAAVKSLLNMQGKMVEDDEIVDFWPPIETEDEDADSDW